MILRIKFPVFQIMSNNSKKLGHVFKLFLSLAIIKKSLKYEKITVSNFLNSLPYRWETKQITLSFVYVIRPNQIASLHLTYRLLFCMQREVKYLCPRTKYQDSSYMATQLHPSLCCPCGISRQREMTSPVACHFIQIICYKDRKKVK